MADAHVGVTDVSGGRQVDTSELTVGGVVVQRQRLVVADDFNAAALARVRNGAPSGADYAQVVRLVPLAWSAPARVGQSAAAVSLLAANAARRAVRLVNQATVALYVRLDAAPPVLTAGTEAYHYAMPAGSTLELGDGEAGVAQLQGVWAGGGGGFAMVSEAA